MKRFPTQIHIHIYILALSIIAFALPLSVFLITVGQTILLLNWLLEKPLAYRWKKFKNCKALWFISIFYFIHIIGLINSSNFGFAFNDLRIKLPFLLVPLVIGTSEPIRVTGLKQILHAFIAGVFISSSFSAFRIFTVSGDIVAQMRYISPFVWHIRLALMVAFSVSVIPWLFNNTHKRLLRIIYCILLVWLALFLFILQSLTGIVILVITSSGILIYYIRKSKQLMLQWTFVVMALSAILIMCSYILHLYTQNFCPLPVDSKLLATHTNKGNIYHHDTRSLLIENGNYVNIYICDKELEEEWPKRSNLQLHGEDNNHNLVKLTLLRYLTSKGLRKDANGVDQLTDTDIQHIEQGIANTLYLQKTGIKPRLYRLMWELYYYSLGANPTGYSVSSRIEYLKTASHAIKRNFWFGTGTGDVLDQLQSQYQTDRSPLTPEWRLRAHNQFVTFLLTFGIFGFLLLMAAIFIPPYIEGKYTDYLFVVFFVVFILSMLGDDTLETHAGISFIVLFYSVLLFRENIPNDISPEKKPD
jgi:hypothetical protein